MGNKKPTEVTSSKTASVASKVLRDPRSSVQAKTAAASALTQRVVKESSRTHSEALKRLVDR
jgi:hypothetical protein